MIRDWRGEMVAEDTVCCRRGVYARGTAGKGHGDIVACVGCHRDVGVRNGETERAREAAYRRAQLDG